MDIASRSVVLVVDDDEMTQELICGILGDGHRLLRASSGAECIEMLGKHQVDVVLLDVNMPGMDGLETCRKIRKMPAYRNLSIIFVSASDSKDEIVAGYEAGADDYITKPFHGDSLVARVEHNSRLYHKRQASSRHDDVDPDEMRRVKILLPPLVQFIEHSQSATTHDAVIEKLFHLTQQLHLSCRAQVRGHHQFQYFADDGMLRPIESNLLEQMHRQGQCCEFGKRLILNFSEVSLLVRNLTIDDEPLRQDIILVLTQAMRIANTKIASINARGEREKLVENLSQIIEAACETVGFLHQQFCDHTRKSHEVHDTVTNDIMKNLETLGLTDEQEEFLNQVIDRGMQKLLALSNESVLIENNINSFSRELRENHRKHAATAKN